MNTQNYQIFTHKDLDGAVSLLTFLWSKPQASVTYREVTNLEHDVMKEYVKKTCNPPNILIMDLSLREEFIPELDYDYITFIDHHKRSEEHVKKFKQAKIHLEQTTSNALLVRKLFKNDSPELSEAQKKLILFADDHDSGENKFEESYNLNILFWTQFRNEFCYFVEYYKNGFKPFSQKQHEIINHAKDDAKINFMNTNFFSGEIVIEGFPQKVMAGLTENYNTIVIDMIMSKYNPDILFYINTKSERVTLRQKKRKNPIDLSAFAAKYCDGSGHIYASGGKVTPLFMEFTKKLKPIA
jgi:oligoribonuclease NrnB/cAMP/cGMP phosphodiesterase (DHH superfamily)